MLDYTQQGLNKYLEADDGPVAQRKTFTQSIKFDINYDRNAIIRYNLRQPPWITVADAATVVFDLSQGIRQRVILGGNRTLQVINGLVGQTFIVKLIQDGTGSRTVTWFTTITWAGGGVPALTTTANKADEFGFIVTANQAYDGVIIGLNF